MKRDVPKLKKAIELVASIEPDMERLLGIQAKALRSYYNQLKKG